MALDKTIHFLARIDSFHLFPVFFRSEFLELRSLMGWGEIALDLVFISVYCSPYCKSTTALANFDSKFVKFCVVVMQQILKLTRLPLSSFWVSFTKQRFVVFDALVYYFVLF